MTHDMSEFWEPQPRIVTPADMDRAVPPPSDAVVLLGLDADDTPEWIGCDGKPVAWSIEDGVMTGDLYALSTLENKTSVDTETFLREINERLQKLLQK